MLNEETKNAQIISDKALDAVAGGINAGTVRSKMFDEIFSGAKSSTTNAKTAQDVLKNIGAGILTDNPSNAR